MLNGTTYQQGSLKLKERKRGPHVWIFRWWDTDANGTAYTASSKVGNLSEYPERQSSAVAPHPPKTLQLNGP